METRMLSSLGLLAIVCLTGVAAQCSWITLSGSQNNNDGINGEYELTDDESCDHLDDDDDDDRDAWIQQQGSGKNYIFFDDDYNRWVVAPSQCPDGRFAAIAFRDDDYDYPYDVPKGYWKEKESHGDGYIDSPNLNICCNSSGLTGWEIFGIVIGCICGVILIALVIGLLYAHHKHKKRDRAAPANTAAAAAPNTAASWAATGNVSTTANTQPNTYEFELSKHPASSAPPPYPPPPYDSKDMPKYAYDSHAV